MKNVMLLSLFLFAILPHQAFAFKWSKCKKEYAHSSAAKSNSKDFGSMVANYLADFTSQASIHSSTSTSSFVSSTGNCAAFAKADDERKLFIAESLVEIKMEAAEGRGEHLSSLATLYGCENGLKSDFFQMMKSNHNTLFSNDAAKSPEVLHDQIMNNLMNVKTLHDHCNIERT